MILIITIIITVFVIIVKSTTIASSIFLQITQYYE